MAVTRRSGVGLRKKRPSKRKHHYLSSMTDVPTQSENLLYLLTELELAVERPTVEWSAELAASVQRRLAKLVRVVHQVARRDC